MNDLLTFLSGLIIGLLIAVMLGIWVIYLETKSKK